MVKLVRVCPKDLHVQTKLLCFVNVPNAELTKKKKTLCRKWNCFQNVISKRGYSRMGVIEQALKFFFSGEWQMSVEYVQRDMT